MSENNKYCPDCYQENINSNRCQNCNSNLLQRELIDTFIQDTRWIIYDRFINIQHLTQGESSTIYKARLDGLIIENWDKEELEEELEEEDDEIAEQEEQENEELPLNENEICDDYVVLKSLNNLSCINENFLNKWKHYIKFACNSKGIINIYGITQDPKTSNYMIVMPYMPLGNLRSNLMIKKYNPNDKYSNLLDIAESLSKLHECNLVHGNLHSGNILLRDHASAYINAPDQHMDSENICYGVLPYIAPEVLRREPYTKAADVYSFGIIMCEMTSGVPAYSNVLPCDDIDLVIKICDGLRPKIIEDTEIEYKELMESCWVADPDNRPTAEKLSEYFKKWKMKFPYDMNRVPVPENERIIQNHPLKSKSSKESLMLNFLNFNDEKDCNEIFYKTCEDLENIRISDSEFDE